MTPVCKPLLTVSGSQILNQDPCCCWSAVGDARRQTRACWSLDYSAELNQQRKDPNKPSPGWLNGTNMNLCCLKPVIQPKAPACMHSFTIVNEHIGHKAGRLTGCTRRCAEGGAARQCFRCSMRVPFGLPGCFCFGSLCCLLCCLVLPQVVQKLFGQLPISHKNVFYLH